MCELYFEIPGEVTLILGFEKASNSAREARMHCVRAVKVLQYFGRIDDNLKIPVSVSSYFATASAATSLQRGGSRGCSKWKGALME